MILDFIISHLNAISLMVWTLFLIIVAIKYIKPLWLQRLSFPLLLGIAIGLQLFYGAFVTWGQYHVWSTKDETTQSFLTAPLSPLAPIPAIFEWTREYFDGSFGYFTYYVLGRVWFEIFMLLGVTGVFYGLLRLLQSHRGRFIPHGPEFIALLLVIVGWPNVLILIPIAFLLAISASSILSLKEVKRVRMESAFLFAAPLVLLFGYMVFDYLLLSKAFTV